MALVAGNALSENIVREIGSRALAFRPDDRYRSLIQTAGADAAVVASALIDTLAANLDGAGKANPDAVRKVLDQVRALAEGVRGTQVPA